MTTPSYQIQFVAHVYLFGFTHLLLKQYHQNVTEYH